MGECGSGDESRRAYDASSAVSSLTLRAYCALSTGATVNFQLDYVKIKYDRMFQLTQFTTVGKMNERACGLSLV
jgi:hypothetical protein